MDVCGAHIDVGRLCVLLARRGVTVGVTVTLTLAVRVTVVGTAEVDMSVLVKYTPHAATHRVS